MKRKRGIAKLKPKRSSLVGENEAVQKNMDGDFSVDDLLCEYDAMEPEEREAEPSMNDHQAALDQVIAKTVNSVRNTNNSMSGNLSKFAASTPAKSSRGPSMYAECDSRMETEAPRAATNMNGRQTDSEKGGVAVNGMMLVSPDTLREMILSIIGDISKEPGSITAKLSSGVGNNPISNVPVFQTQGERTHQEVAHTQDPQYKEEEINASLSVIKKIMKLKEAEPFSIPVDPIALGIPDYFDVIDTPMDFGTICCNLENSHKYMNSEDVYKDVQQIWENCSKYNKTGDYILELMKRVKMKFLKYWSAAGLHTNYDLTTDGSTMMGSIQRKEFAVHNVPNEVEASHVQRHQPSSIFQRGYQPHLNSNEPNFSLGTAGVNVSSSAGYSHLQLPTEPNMRHSVHRHHLPAVPVSDKTSPGQAKVYQPSAIDNQPQLSSNQPQPFQRHTEVNTCTSGYPQLNIPTDPTLRHSTRSQKRSVGGVADSARQSQVLFRGGSKKDNQPQLSSSQSHEQVDLDTAEEFSPSPPSDSSMGGKECPVAPEIQQNNLESSKEQYYQSPLFQSQAYPQPMSIPLQIDAGKRHGRGPTRGLKLLTTAGRIHVSTNELGQPIGTGAPPLTTFLGVMSRDGNLAPLTYPNWHKLPKENKEDMWQKVQSKFDIDPASKTWVLKSLAKKWRSFKSTLKSNHYDKHSTDAERLADRNPRVLPDQWSVLVAQWSSEKWQQLSARNKITRSNQKFSHTTGQKSFARIREEEKAKRPDGKEPSRAELFILTRTRKDGKPVNEETAAVISQLRERAAQQPNTAENNNDSQGDILAQVLGSDKANTCLQGLGPSPTSLGAQNPSRADLIRMVSEANAKVHEMSTQMATMMSMMTSMHNSQNKRKSKEVAETSDDSEELPPPSVHTSTSRRVVPSRQVKEKQARKRT